MKTPQEIQKRLAEIANLYDKASHSERIYLNNERHVLRWVLNHDIDDKRKKPVRLASKIVKNTMA